MSLPTKKAEGAKSTPPSKRHRTSRSMYADECIASYEARLDNLLATPAPVMMDLQEVLRLLQGRLLEIIAQKRKGKAIWMALRQESKTFRWSYRSFARALARFRNENGISPAYEARKSKSKMESTKPVSDVPFPSEMGLAEPVSAVASSKVEQLSALQSETLPGPCTPTVQPAAAPAKDASDAPQDLEAFLAERFSMAFDANSFKSNDELRRIQLASRNPSAWPYDDHE